MHGNVKGNKDTLGSWGKTERKREKVTGNRKRYLLIPGGKMFVVSVVWNSCFSYKLFDKLHTSH